MGAIGIAIGALLFVLLPREAEAPAQTRPTSDQRGFLQTTGAAIRRCSDPTVDLAGMISRLLYCIRRLFDMVWGVRYLRMRAARGVRIGGCCTGQRA
jgi:hypothetical protein